MIRNCMKTLLCLILALMLPLCALADVQHTLKVMPGSAMGADQAVADLMGALSLKLTQGETSGALTIALEDTDIATAALTADATGLYVHSNLLSDDVLYVTWDDGFAYLTEMFRSELVAQGLPQSDLTAMETAMAEMKDAIVTAAGSGTVTGVTGSLEANAAAAVQMLQDDPEMQAFAEMIYGSTTIESGSFTDAERDTADQKYTIIMDAEALLKLCDTQYMRTLMREVAAAVAQSDAQDEAALEKATDEMLEQVREVYRNSNYEAVVTVYTQNGGTVMVGMEMGMTMDVKEEETTTAVGVNVNYDQLSDENGVAYRADMNVMMDGSSALQMAFDLHRGVNEVSEGSFAMLADGEEITFAYRAENTQPDVRERHVDLYLRSGATAIIEPAFSDRPLISFDVITAPADPAVLAAVEQAEPHNSVNVMKLSDEEMQALGTGIATRCMQALYSALAKLPTSALQLAMRLMQ